MRHFTSGRGCAAAVAMVGMLAGLAGTSAPPASAQQAVTHSSPSPASTRLSYPKARRSDQTDTFHGTAVADPYRWLEDPDSPETRAWIDEQNKVTFGYLGNLPGREKLKKRLTELWDYERYGAHFKRGGRYFWFHNTGLQNQSVLYTAPSLNEKGTVLIDPNTLSPDGTVALGAMDVTKDGKQIAYTLARSGSDWQEARVRDIATGKDLPDSVQWVKFSSPDWSPDGKGFYYQRYPEPAAKDRLQGANLNAKAYYHRVGDEQSKDRLLYERPDRPQMNFGIAPTEDGRYVVLMPSEGTSRNMVAVLDLQQQDAKPRELVSELVADYYFAGNRGPVMYFHTNHDAPTWRIVSVDVSEPGAPQWKVVVPAQTETLEAARIAGDRFVLSYLKDAYSQVRIHELDGRRVRDIALPGIGTVQVFGGESTDPELFFAFTSFTTPGQVHRHDVRSGDTTLLRQPKVAFDPGLFETRQVFYTSKDGTKVPLFLVHKKGLTMNGQNPTYLYGYGGFNISLQPAFSVSNLAWVEMGGVFAQACLRGGGEYGEAWHEAGTKQKKQNVFDDFIGAAEYLVKEKVTSPKKLAIGGGSNGGLLVGAVLNQRPDLFGAALPAVGVMDMLRFHKFTIGHAWTADYGSPDDAKVFPALRAYSPLHNLKVGTKYPAVMVLTADHDDRVVPGHSFKYAATLQHAQEGPAPVLIRIDVKAGHGAGKPVTKVIEEASDRWAFVANALGMGL